MAKTFEDLSSLMRKIDFCMLSTRADGGKFASRPMSNNGEVAFDGTSWFFTYDTTHTVAEIAREPTVGLTFTGAAGLLGGPPLFVAIEATAQLIRDKSAFAEHWTTGLGRWFPEGLDTPGLILIKTVGERLHYWDGKDEGELML